MANVDFFFYKMIRVLGGLGIIYLYNKNIIASVGFPKSYVRDKCQDILNKKKLK